MRVQAKPGDPADPDAVEQDRGAGAQARDRAGKHHTVARALPAASGILEPKDEPEHADDDGERERAGHAVVGPGPHDRSLCSLSVARSSAIPFYMREPICMDRPCVASPM